MLSVLPAEVTLSVLTHLPIPSLLSLPALSRQWLDFFATNESEIFHHAAIFHEYIKPETLLLEDALSAYEGKPWTGATSWKDFCKLHLPHTGHFDCTPYNSHCEGHRSFQFRRNWEGKGRAVARLLSPPGTMVHRIKIDEKAGICITTHMLGGVSVIHLFSSTVLWALPQVRGLFS